MFQISRLKYFFVMILWKIDITNYPFASKFSNVKQIGDFFVGFTLRWKPFEVHKRLIKISVRSCTLHIAFKQNQIETLHADTKNIIFFAQSTSSPTFFLYHRLVQTNNFSRDEKKRREKYGISV